MASLRDIRVRIGSIKNTRQITNAMKMVSAAKLRRATEAATSARPYQQRLTATLSRVAASAGDIEHPLLTRREHVSKVLVVWVTSDRGLCGGFNNTLNRRTLDFVKKLREQGKTVEIRTFGKKARDFARIRGLENAAVRIDVKPAKFQDEVLALATTLTQGFADGTYDEVYLAYNAFKSTLNQVPSFPRVLPLSLEGAAAADVGGPEFKYEPSGREILGVLLPLYLRTLLLQTFLENEAGEHASRMAAMDNATRNANDLIKSLTLEYNRGRQAAITKELIEIVSGAEAL